MKLYLLLFCLCIINSYSQKNLPIIKSTSSEVDIRVGEDYYVKGGWHLDPGANPDVFSIGSKWNYKSKKVSFITDIDSISFNVKPNSNYDFVILLNGNKRCHIQIATSANPYFMQTKVVIPIIIFFLALGSIIYLKRHSLPVKLFLRLGLIIPLLFWITTLIGGKIHGHYVHYKDVISELGSIGSKSEIFMSSTFAFLAILCFLFSIGFYSISKKLGISAIPAILSFSMPVTFFWAAIFPLKNEFHSLTGPLPLFIILGALLASIIWRKHQNLKKLRILSIISFIIMLLILFRFIRPLGFDYEGLVQRFFYLGWSVWLLSISFLMNRAL